MDGINLDIDDVLLKKAETAEVRDQLSVLIDRLNVRYAVVNEAGKAVVYERIRDPILDRYVIVRITFEDLRKLYMNQRLVVTAHGKPIIKSVADWWLQDERRRQYLGGVVFDPTGNAPADCWNLWSGFSVEPTPGDWSLMRQHIEKVVCGGNQGDSDYLLNWLARLFQKPEVAGQVAVVLRGLKGCGKGILCNWIVRAYGQHGLRIGHAAHLTGNFNDHLRDCVFLFADEAFFAGNKEHEGVLKGLVTDPTIAVEGKYKAVVAVCNLLHIIMASNSDWVVPASHDERRYFVRDVLGTKIGDRRYFNDIAEQMENGGLAAMIYDLLNRDITEFDVYDVPQTEALADQKTLSLDSLDKWWMAVLERGFVWESRFGLPAFDVWEPFVSTQLLHKSYLQWCSRNQERRPKDATQLGKRMTEMYHGARPRQDSIIREVEAPNGPADDKLLIVTQYRAPGYDVGTLSEARAKFTMVRGVPMDWPDEEPDEAAHRQGGKKYEAF